MTIIKRNSISLSANASENGFPLTARPFLTPGAGDFAGRVEGRDRRKVRRLRISDKRSFLSGM
jgi:hypothetical protein